MRATCLLLLLLAAAAPHVAVGQLPGESVLPGESADSNDGAAEPRSLPSESALPAYNIAWQSSFDQTTDDDPSEETPIAADHDDENDDEGQAAQGVDLPSEGQLPAPPNDAASPNENDGPEPVRGAGLPVAGSPDGIPWLRLNLSGHSAPIRALTFTAEGERLCSAGDDKALLVWRNAATGGGQVGRWTHERSVRWQVQRGDRGRIYALAAGPDYVAIAGNGAMGGTGEILLIDPQSGRLRATLNDLELGHRQVVVSLSVAPNSQGRALASLSMDGCLVLWTQGDDGLWRAARLRGTDAEIYPDDPALVDRLLLGRKFAAAAALSRRRIVAPAYAGQRNGRTIWRLERLDAATGGSAPLVADDQTAPHWDFVTSIAVSGDGTLLASADGGGNVYLWDLSGPSARMRRLPQLQAAALSLSMDASGNRLAVATTAPAAGRASVAVWDVADFSSPRLAARFETDQSVLACALNPAGDRAAWTVGAAVQVRPIGGNTVATLRPGASAPTRVAFPQQQPYHVLGIARSASGASAPAITHRFDTSRLRLDVLNPNRAGPRAAGQPGATRWLPDDWLSRGWNLRTSRQADGQTTTWMYDAATRKASLPLREELHGVARTVCWIPSRQPNARPAAAAVGTSSGGIFLYQLADDGAAPTIRQLRGHTAEVASLAVSRDLRYLASASLDGTVRVWPLKDVVNDSPLVQRWGADFQVRDGELIAAAIRTDGPAYFRGIRQGDRITELQYMDGAQKKVVNDPEQMRAALGEVSWDTLMSFQFTRGRAQPRQFQILPSWQQLATLFVADEGQWAYWAPAGYYDASFEGHKLFGWQINRGLAMLPDYFLAAQFRQQLERPRVMSRLLQSGSLEAAFQAARLQPPANSPEAIVDAYRLKPRVEILTPNHGDVVAQGAKLRARISVDAVERLAPPKAFANGVVATSRRLVDTSTADGRRSETYEWDLALPSDPRQLLQVVAATENEITETDQVEVAYIPPPNSQPRRLYLLSVGVDDYRDAQIPKLSTAVQSTRDFRTLVEQRSNPLFEIDSLALVDQRASKPAWRYLTRDFADRLRRDARPDDLFVLLLSGHGVQGADDAGYQFVTADARYADVLSGKYADCLSFADLSLLADVSCRKLVILNTCHGGSIQPLMHRDLKAAVRELQHDLLITLAASGGEQEAVEGRFARRLLEALGGAADANADGLVDFNETVAYVQRTVEADSTGDAVRQIPTAGPRELLPYLSIGLAKASGATAVRPPTTPAQLAAFDRATESVAP